MHVGDWAGTRAHAFTLPAGSNEYAISWSPDSTLVALSGPAEIVLRPDATVARSWPESTGAGVWSPRGHAIAADAQREVMVFDPDDGSAITMQGAAPNPSYPPAWSSDGRYVLWVDADGSPGGGQISIGHLDGTSTEIAAAGNLWLAAWQPAHDVFAWPSPAGVSVYDVATATTTTLPTPTETTDWLAWAPDGTHLVWSGAYGSDADPPFVVQPAVSVMAADGTGITRITPTNNARRNLHGESYWSALWAPDSRLVAFFGTSYSVGLSVGTGVYGVADTITGQVVATSMLGFAADSHPIGVGSAAWSPDGAWLMVNTATPSWLINPFVREPSSTRFLSAQGASRHEIDGVSTWYPRTAPAAQLAATLTIDSGTTAAHATLTISNDGPCAANNVVGHLALPPGVTAASAQAGFTGTTWSVGTLNPGASATINLALATNPVAGTEAVTATFTSSTTLFTPEPVATVTITVPGGAPPTTTNPAAVDPTPPPATPVVATPSLTG